MIGGSWWQEWPEFSAQIGDEEAKNRVLEGVKKCWDSQPAAEAAIDSTRLLGRRL